MSAALLAARPTGHLHITSPHGDTAWWPGSGGHSCCRQRRGARHTTAQATCQSGRVVNSESAVSLPSRRDSLVFAISAAAPGWASTVVKPAAAAPSPGQSEVPMIEFSPEDGAWEVLYPSAWVAVPGLDLSSNLQASFYNPESPGETIAIFNLPAERALSVADLGTAEEVGVRLATAAPGYQLISATRERQGHSSRYPYYYTHIHALGMAAGSYGEAEEFRAITVRREVQYVCRVTATTERLEGSVALQNVVKTVLNSFIVRAV